MKLRTFSIAILASMLVASATAPGAFAHTHVSKTSIAENAKLAASPPDFTVTFEGKTKLASIALTDAAGKVVPLAYKPPPAKAASFKIPLPTLSPGLYRLMWRTIGADAHAMSGMVHFTVAHS